MKIRAFDVIVSPLSAYSVLSNIASEFRNQSSTFVQNQFSRSTTCDLASPFPNTLFRIQNNVAVQRSAPFHLEFFLSPYHRYRSNASEKCTFNIRGIWNFECEKSCYWPPLNRLNWFNAFFDVKSPISFSVSVFLMRILDGTREFYSNTHLGGHMYKHFWDCAWDAWMSCQLSRKGYYYRS